MTAQEIQQYVYDFLYDKGLPHQSIIATMGNITGESSWDVNMIEVGSGVGFGLCQWSYSRRTQLENYGTDLYYQCEFMWSELTGENTAVTGAELQWINPPSSAVTGGESFSCQLTDFMQGNGSVEFLTTAWCYCWERPAYETNHLSTIRIPSALDFNSSMTYQGSGSGGNGGELVENAVLWMISIANDDSHGYDQESRWSPDYDCSSFVITGYEQAGIPLKTNGATYTGNMKQVALNTGFEEVAWNNDVNNLVRGDIILNELRHVCVYIGDGQIVQASINELGTTTGGQTGDQTGREIYTRSYYTYSYGWDCVLRYGGGSTGGTGGNIPSDYVFDDDYFYDYEAYFNNYDDLSEVYKKMQTTPYIFNQLTTEFIDFIRTLNFNDKVHMKFTFNRNKYYIGHNFTGKQLTFTAEEYIIIDVKNNGYFVIATSGNICYKTINPLYIYQTEAEKQATKEINVAKIRQHIKDEIEASQQEEEN